MLLGVAIAGGIFIGGKLDFADSNDRLFTSNSKKDKLNRLIDYIDHEYVDDVNTDSIVDVTVNRILDNLDPHSTYIPKESRYGRLGMMEFVPKVKEAWEKGMAYIAKNNLELIEEGPMLESYLTDPTSQPNPADWVTEIFLAVK